MASTNSEELCWLGAWRIVGLLRNREVSAQEVVKAQLARIERVNPKLNAIVLLYGDESLERAKAIDEGRIERGMLAGLPITYKQNIQRRGRICTAGTLGQAPVVANEDALVLKRLLDEGANDVGSTNMPEIGLAVETDNLVFGRTDNPYNLLRTPGGSTGGGAAAVSAGMSYLELGSDIGGSGRTPAHCCGVVGFKPNSGRIPLAGLKPGIGGFTDSMRQPALLCRSVRDLYLAFPIVAGFDWQDRILDPGVIAMPVHLRKRTSFKDLRVAFYTEDGRCKAAPAIAQTVRKVAKILSEQGAIVEEKRPHVLDQTLDLFLGLLGADGGQSVRNGLAAMGTEEQELSPLIHHALEIFKPYGTGATGLIRRGAQWRQYNSAMLSFMKAYDIIICPVNGELALPHGTTFDKLETFAFAMTSNLTGWPAIAIPAGFDDTLGLPVGVQIVARPWQESLALSVALRLEALLHNPVPRPNL